MEKRELEASVKKDNYIKEWRFGGNEVESNNLFDLVLEGRKTATCYLLEYDEPLTEKNKISILTNFDKTQKIKVKTIKKYLCKYCDITNEHAVKEGEGDLSLIYWRKVHKNFFTKELQELGKTFSDDILLACEEFTILKN